MSKHLYVLLYLLSLSHCIYAEIDLSSLFTLKLDTSTPIRIQPDFSSVGDDFGKSMGRGIGYLFSDGARSFADTMSNDQYRGDLSRGMKGFADNLGDGFSNFNDNAEQKLFPEMGRSFRGIIGSGINLRNTFQFGGLIALSFIVSATGYYLTKFFWEILTHKVLNPKPVILLPGTTYGWWDRVKRWWSKYESPVMICDELVKDRFADIEIKTKYIRSHNKIRKNKHRQLTYDNLLLCGEPGTGKTLFAHVLADRTDMDVVITTAASLLQSGVSGVKYFNDIMRMAQRSKYGLIIFIDEADALFVDRDSLNPDSDHYKVLSHILALTGEGSNKFMLIAATNHAKVMDSAMGRRFQDRIDMPLPSFATRVELITMYVTKELDKHTQQLFSSQQIDLIADKVEGLSHAEIADMIRSIGKRAYAHDVSHADVHTSIANAVQKHHKTQEEKVMRENALQAWHHYAQKMFMTT